MIIRQNFRQKNCSNYDIFVDKASLYVNVQQKKLISSISKRLESIQHGKVSSSTSSIILISHKINFECLKNGSGLWGNEILCLKWY